MTSIRSPGKGISTNISTRNFRDARLITIRVIPPVLHSPALGVSRHAAEPSAAAPDQTTPFACPVASCDAVASTPPPTPAWPLPCSSTSKTYSSQTASARDLLFSCMSPRLLDECMISASFVIPMLHSPPGRIPSCAFCADLLRYGAWFGFGVPVGWHPRIFPPPPRGTR
jgi:hypothetical protein